MADRDRDPDPDRDRDRDRDRDPWAWAAAGNLQLCDPADRRREARPDAALREEAGTRRTGTERVSEARLPIGN